MTGKDYDIDKRPRIVVLISGSGAPYAQALSLYKLMLSSGSNLQALIDAQPSFNIIHIISSRSSAYGLTRAKIHNIPSSTLALKPWLTAHPGKSREDYDAALAKLVLDQAPDLVVLAGWMLVLSPAFLNPLVKPSSSKEAAEAEADKIPIINLHPALPNAFDGANAIARAHAAFQAGEITKTGVMIHEVIPDVDKGKPLIVREIEMRKGESVEALEERIHQVEHEIIVEAVRLLTDQMMAASSSSI